jgi:hypothetical protein
MRSMVEGASRQRFASSLMPLPPSFALPRSGWSPFPASRGRKESSFPRRLFASELCLQTERRNGLAEAVCRSPLNGGLPANKAKRSAERRIVQPCPHRQTSLRNSSVRGCVRFAFLRHAAFRRSRLRHSPPATTPMAQLQNRVSRGGRCRVFLPLRQPKKKDCRD